MADLKKLLESIDQIGEGKTKPTAPAPRNVVAKNAKTSGAGQHKNPKDLENTRGEKHKKNFLKDLHEAEKDTRTLRKVQEAYTKFKQEVTEGLSNTLAGKIMGAAPQNKYSVGQVVSYETDDLNDRTGRGTGTITKVLKDGVHYVINGEKLVNHFEIKKVQGVAEGWKGKLAGAALGAAALGGIGKVIHDNPNVTIDGVTYAKAIATPDRDRAKELKVQTDEHGNKIYTFYYKAKRGYRPYYYPVEEKVDESVTSPEIKQAYDAIMKTTPKTPERKRAIAYYQRLRADAMQKKRQGVDEAGTIPSSPTAPTSATSATTTSATQQKPLNLQAVQQQLKIPGNPAPTGTTNPNDPQGLAVQAVVQKAMAGKPLDSVENNLYHSILQKANK